MDKRFVYDALGRMVERAAGADHTIIRTRGTRGLKTGHSWSDTLPTVPDVEITYVRDQAGRVESADDARLDLDYTYDPTHGRLATLTCGRVDERGAGRVRRDDVRDRVRVR